MPENFEAGVRFVATDEGVSATTEKMGTHFERTTEKMRQTIKQTGYLRLALTRIATYTAIFTFFGALTKLIGEAISLQTRLAEVSTLVDMRNKEMAESFRIVTGDLLALSPYLGRATDLTKGLYEIMSAGVTKPAEAFKLLVVSAKYAKAGITDLATAASSLTAIMKAYGYTADEMRGKSDMLFASVMEGKYHAEELNQAIGKVLPTAAAMGVQIDEVSAALAVMTQRGLDVNEAATALNRMMLAFMRPIDKAKKEFQKLGWAWGRNAFEGIGLVGVLRRLVEASARYGDILPKIFRRQRALRGAFVLAGEGFKDYVRLLQKIRDATEDGGEVARGFGKMIGTVAEEVKAAGAKMLKIMYELWEGKGFKWLGGFVRLASEFISVLLKASVVSLAALPIIWRLGRAYKVAAVAKLTELTYVQKYTKVLKGMTVAEIMHTKTLSAGNKALMLRHKIFMLVRGGLVAGVVAYIAIKAATDWYISSLDKAIAAMHQESRAMKALRDELNLYAAAANQAGDVSRNVAKELRALAKAAVLTTLRRSEKDLGMFRDITKALFEEFRAGSPTLKTMDEDVNRFIKALRAGQEDMTEFNWIIEALARNWEYTTKRIEEWIDVQRTSLGTMEKYIEALRFLNRVQRDWNKIVESSSQHARGLARELSKEELEDAIKLLGELMELTPEDPKWIMAMTYLQSLGFSLEKLTEKTLPEFKKKFEEALRAQPDVFREMKYEEFMREYLVAFEKMHPPLRDLEEMVRALADTWTIRWKEAYGESAEIMKVFVSKYRTQLELIKNNLGRLGDMEGKVLVENFIKLLDKRLTVQEQAAKKALALHETLINDFIRVDTNLEQMRNELRGEEYNNIVEQTEKLVALEQRKLDKWVKLEMQGGKTISEIWNELVQKKLKLNEMLELAEQVGRQRMMEAQMTENQRILAMDYEFSWQRIAAAEKMYRDMEAQIKGMTDVSEEEMNHLLGLLARFMQYINKLKTVATAWTPWIDSLRFGQKILRALVSQLGDFASMLGVTGGALKRLIDVLDAVSKGLGTVRTGMEMIEYASSAAVSGIAATMMKVAGWISIVIGVITMLVSVFKALFGKEQQTEAEIMAERIRKVQRELSNFGDISEGTARQFYDLSKKIGKSNALLKMLTDIMSDAGVTTVNFTEYMDVLLDTLRDLERTLGDTLPETERRLRNIDREVQRGRRSLRGYRDSWRDTYRGFQEYSPEEIEQAIVDLGTAFVALIEHAKRLGLEGTPELIEFIQGLRELGLVVQEVDEYVFEWLTRASTGLTAMIVASRGTKEELSRLGELTMAVFNSLIVQGMGWIDALSLMEEPLHELRRRYRALGDESNVAVETLLKIAFVAEKYQDLFAAISGTNEVLEALGNTGFLTQKELTAVAEQAQSYYERLIATGLSAQAALAIMAPTLQNLQRYAENYGLVLDDVTLALIAQAIEFGVLETRGKDVATVLEAGFGDMVTAIISLTDLLREFLDSLIDIGNTGVDAFDDLNISLDNTLYRLYKMKTLTDTMQMMGLTSAYSGIPEAQRGIEDIGQTQLIRVHRGESVIPEDLAEALRQFYGGAPSVPSGGEGGRLTAYIDIDGRAVYKALVPYIREGGEHGDFEINGAAVQ